MTSAPDTILGKKTAKRQPAKSRSSFSPAMLEDVCDEIGDALTELFVTRSRVALESVGV